MQLNQLTQEILTALNAEPYNPGTLLVCMTSGLPLRIQGFNCSPLRLPAHPIFLPENRKELLRMIKHPSAPLLLLAGACLALAHQSGRLIPTDDPLEVRRLNKALQSLGAPTLLSLIDSFQKDARPNLRPQIQAKELVNNLSLLAYQFRLMSGQISLNDPLDEALGDSLPLRAYQLATNTRARKVHKMDPDSVFSRLPKLLVEQAKDHDNLLGFKTAKALKEHFELLTYRKHSTANALSSMIDYLQMADEAFQDHILSNNIQVAVAELTIQIERINSSAGLPDLEEDMPF